MEAKQIKPVKETKKYEIEVYVAFYQDGHPFVTASVVGASSYIPTGDLVERYVFEVERPMVIKKSLKGQL